MERKITNQKIKGSVEKADFSAHLSTERPNFDELHFRVRTAEKNLQVQILAEIPRSCKMTEILRKVRLKRNMFLCLIKYPPIRVYGRVEV